MQGVRAAALGLVTLIKGALDTPIPQNVPRVAVESGAQVGVATALQTSWSPRLQVIF